MTQPAIAFVLGKPAERSPVIGDVVAHVRELAGAVQVHTPGNTALDVAAIAAADVVAVRGVRRSVLASLASVRGPARWVNPPAALLALDDRSHVQQRLALAGLGVPGHARLDTWAQVTAHVAGQPCVVKAADPSVGRGARVLPLTEGIAPAAPPFDGPYVVEDFIAGDGVDRKLYVIGERVAGLRKPWPRQADDVAPLTVDAALASLGRRAAAAAGLTICGVDVIVGPDGPVIVDVNPFPSCNGVPGAAASIAECLLRVV